jgi:hypothetical protein
MGVAKNIERRLEGLLEGFFTRVFRSGLQPVEVGRRILREMGEGRTISVNRTYAPNEFHVLMGEDDYERFTKMEAGLQREFSELVIDQAKTNRWNLMGTPRIFFEVEESYGKGQFVVEASLAADADVGRPGVSTREPSAEDASATRAISSSSAERLGLARGSAELVVLGDGEEEVERISLTSGPVTVGRMSTNDVVLSDRNVSRRHAELRRQDDHWMLVDLGSTNGSLVNGKLAREHRLSDGDRMSFGTTELIFREAGA